MGNQCQGPIIDRVYEKAIERNIPLSALFELTHRCNLSCRHCYVVPDGKKELTYDEICHILDQLAEAGTLFLTFSGGEILLREDFFEIMSYASTKKFAVRLFTNGIKITKIVADKIAALTPLDVSISIYGSNAGSHDFVTRKDGSFDASVTALKLLNERGVATRIKCVLMKHNVKDIGQIVALADELGATPQFDPMVTPRNDNDAAPVAHRIDDIDLAALINEDEPRGDVSPEDIITCAAGRDMATISPSGGVYPCVQLPIEFGNLREQSFSDIWLGSSEAVKIRSLRVSSIEKCASCADLKYCRPCLGLNIIETGDMLKPSQANCWVANIRKQATKAREKGGLYEIKV